MSTWISRIVAGMVSFASACLMGFVLGDPASAHGGGLDWQGGHNCRVGSCAGTYHCHQARGGICAAPAPDPLPVPKPKPVRSYTHICTVDQDREECRYGTKFFYGLCLPEEPTSAILMRQKKSNKQWIERNDLDWDMSRKCPSDFPWLTVASGIQKNKEMKYEIRWTVNGGAKYFHDFRAVRESR